MCIKNCGGSADTQKKNNGKAEKDWHDIHRNPCWNTTRTLIRTILSLKQDAAPEQLALIIWRQRSAASTWPDTCKGRSVLCLKEGMVSCNIVEEIGVTLSYCANFVVQRRQRGATNVSSFIMNQQDKQVSSELRGSRRNTNMHYSFSRTSHPPLFMMHKMWRVCLFHSCRN